MSQAIIGKKLGMSQRYNENSRVPVTMIEAGPCIITQIKTTEKDGYQAVQIGFGTRKIKNITKPVLGHLGLIAKEGETQKSSSASRFLREIPLQSDKEYKVGDTINLADVLTGEDTVSITSVTKGKGFAGGIKRWGFAGGPKTHGQSDRHRAPGSIGQGTTPGRVRKGKKMAGRMGSAQLTVKGLKVFSLDTEKNILEVIGSVPGSKGSLLYITKQ